MVRSLERRLELLHQHPEPIDLGLEPLDLYLASSEHSLRHWSQHLQRLVSSFGQDAGARLIWRSLQRGHGLRK